jgi:type I restriction enzyme S subunit
MWLLLSVLPKIKHLEATITGTTVAHLSARDLKSMSLIAPAPDMQRQGDGLLGPIGDAIIVHRHQQRRLAASRDLLLPRLISGELSISAAQRELEAA